MPSESSPRPWRVESDNITLRPPVCFIIDANGSKVSGGFFSPADAALIVDAVNTLAEFEAAHMKFPDFRPVIIAAGQRDAAIDERDRLRDIVRRLADVANSLLGNYEYRFRDDQNSMAFVENTRGFLREARAAIEEDAK